MAITKSAKKAQRQSRRRKSVNDSRRSALRGALKTARAVGKAGGKESVSALADAYQAIDKAMKGGLMTKNTAARRKSAVARLLKTQ